MGPDIAAWEKFKTDSEYATLSGALLKAGIVQPYVDNIMFRIFHKGWVFGSEESRPEAKRVQKKEVRSPMVEFPDYPGKIGKKLIRLYKSVLWSIEYLETGKISDYAREFISYDIGKNLKAARILRKLLKEGYLEIPKTIVEKPVKVEKEREPKTRKRRFPEEKKAKPPRLPKPQNVRVYKNPTPKPAAIPQFRPEKPKEFLKVAIPKEWVLKPEKPNLKPRAAVSMARKEEVVLRYPEPEQKSSIPEELQVKPKTEPKIAVIDLYGRVTYE